MDGSRPWTVLLIGGATGTGKTLLAQALGRRLNVGVIEGDVLRWMAQATVPRGFDPVLHLFSNPGVWNLPVEEIVRGSMHQAQRLCRICEAVMARHHYVQRPVILEAVWLLPEFATQGIYDGVDMTGEVRSVFLHEPDIAELRRRLFARDGEMGLPAEQPSRPLSFFQYGALIKQRAEALGLPVLEPRPFETLEERALRALSLEQTNAGEK